jgi:6-phosphofructokinase 1
MKIGILTSGGDAPGINATIRAVGKTAINYYGMEVIGIQNGFSGLLYEEVVELTSSSLSEILHLGGTILGTAREKTFRKMITSPNEEDKEQIKTAYHKLGLDCLVCIGGNGTQRTTYMLHELGLNVVGVPKTIDNDVFGTDITFGFDTAVNIATEAIDRLHSTAISHRRVMVIELMGHHVGWITLYAGMAGGADIILLPEFGYNMDIVLNHITRRMEMGRAYSIVAVGEGVEVPGKERPARYLTNEIERITGFESRETVLGYIQRGGSPSPYDRILGTQLGSHAARLIFEKKFGRMVAKIAGEITDVNLSEVAGKLRSVTPNTPLVVQGKQMGVSFGV